MQPSDQATRNALQGDLAAFLAHRQQRQQGNATASGPAGSSPMEDGAQQQQLPEQLPEVGPQQVYAVISDALSLDAARRGVAEQALRQWEGDAAPGFVGSLLKIVEERDGVQEGTRLLAAVVAKNAVGSSWRKTLGSREWSRVPAEEKAWVRDAALRCLFGEPSDRVAMQLGLLITNVARFDYPGGWPDLLSSLGAASRADSPDTGLAGKHRALFTLKHTLRALRSKRFVVEAHAGGLGQMTAMDLRSLATKSADEQRDMYSRVRGLFPLLHGEWQANCSVLMNAGEGWQARGALANRGLSAIRELLQLLSSWEGVEGEIGSFLGAVHAASAAVVPIINAASAATSEPPPDSAAVLASKSFERGCQCAMAALDRDPLDFAHYLPPFLSLYVSDSLLAMDSGTVHRIRAKRRVLVTRFLARALLCPYYRADWAGRRPPQGLGQQQRERVEALHAKAAEASAALDELLTGGNGASCTQLVQAIVTKYIQLSPDELMEWQADPEGYVRSMDVETSPDADTPRPCGVALLVCMLDRNKDAVAQAMLALASQLQAVPLSPDTVLVREACYRAIGEAYSHLSKQVDFPAWYSNELRALLAAAPEAGAAEGGGGGGANLPTHILRARALWLVGVCGSDLPPDMWRDAYGLMTAHLTDGDLVVALTAVSSLMVASVGVMEEDRMEEQRREAAKRRTAGRQEMRQRQQQQIAAGGGGAEAMMAAGGGEGDIDEDSQEAEENQDPGLRESREKLRQHKEAVEAHAQTTLSGCFGLVGRLGEPESVVRVLQLVSVVVEVAGEAIKHLFPLFASALPQIWVAAQQQAGAESGSGALARLHSALIATLTHLVSRVGPLALADAGMQSVLYPLLQYATSSTGGEGEVLADEALRLWAVTMTAAPHVTQPLQDLLPNLIRILSRGKDNAAALAILEAYLLLGGPASLEPHMAEVAASLRRVVDRAAAALAVDGGGGGGGRLGGRPGSGSGLSLEESSDLQAAAGLLSVMQQLGMEAVLAAMEPVLRSMAEIIAGPSLGGQVSSERVTGVADAFLEVLAPYMLHRPAALPALLPDEARQAAFADHWVGLASTRYLEELFGVQAIAALARYRRHTSAAALAAVLVSGACPPAAQDLPRAARILALGLRAAGEDNLFQADKAALQRGLTSMDPSSPSHNSVEARRMALQLSDPARAVDVSAALRAATGALMQRHGQEAVLGALEELDPDYRDGLLQLMGMTSSMT